MKLSLKSNNPDEPKPPVEYKTNYKHPYENMKRQKKIRCFVINKSEGIEGEMPSLVAKPRTVKYGKKWFEVNGKQYWIIYEYLKDMGKFYMYLTTEDNAIGAIKFHSHKEYAEPEQVNRMMDYGTVNLFKANNAKKLSRILLFVAIGLAICAIATIILLQLFLGANGQIGRLTTTNTALQVQNAELKTELDTLKLNIPPVPIGGTQ